MTLAEGIEVLSSVATITPTAPCQRDLAFTPKEVAREGHFPVAGPRPGWLNIERPFAQHPEIPWPIGLIKPMVFSVLMLGTPDNAPSKM